MPFKFHYARLLFLLLYLTLSGTQQASSQKLQLDETCISKWSSLSRYCLSEDGNWVYYFASDKSKIYSSKLHIYSVKGEKEFEIDSVRNAVFVNKGKNILYQTLTDSLFLLKSEGKTKKFICITKDFAIINNGRYLVAKNVQVNKVWTVIDFVTFSQRVYSNVISYFLSQNKNGTQDILLYTENLDKPGEKQLLEPSVDPYTEHVVWTGDNLNKAFFIKKANSFALYLTLAIKSHNWSELWVYNVSTKKSILVTDDRKDRMNLKNGRLEEYLIFNNDGTNLIFRLNEKITPKETKESKTALDIWSYMDSFVKSDEQKFFDKGFTTYYSYNLQKDEVHRICDGNNRLFLENGFIRDILIINQPNEAWFRRNQSLGDVYWYNASTGEKNKILDSKKDRYLLAFSSPDEKYIIWYNDIINKWYSFNVERKTIRTIANGVTRSLIDLKADSIGRKGIFGIGGWSTKTKTLFLYDQFDIWAISVDSTKKDINKTGGWGERNNVILRIIDDGLYREIDVSKKVLINGLENSSKKGGYWNINLNKITSQLPTSHLKNYSIDSRRPIGIYWQAYGKISTSSNRNIFLVERENAKTSNNLYITRDLDNYKEISNIHPERIFNWLNAQLITYQLPTGQIAQGILYSSENIDTASKKWPIIFNYYEKRSDEFNKFIIPEYSKHNINIPLFVSHGYLVFIPDIYSSPGKNGAGTLMSISSALNSLKQFSYIDTTKMGLQGHSYGGWQTNFMITHSNKFAAACEAAGVSNQVSGYGQLAYQYGHDRQELYEVKNQGSPYGLEVTPWTNKMLYVDNSPIFNIENVNTPLLMMHNKLDPAVPFEQAIELFLGLRRANKKVWLLQYDGYQHQLDGDAAKDFHTRMLQFFDHFLKGSPMPIWMSKGIPSYLKETCDGLNYNCVH